MVPEPKDTVGGGRRDALKTDAGKMGAMMSVKMMSPMHHQMMMEQNETGKLINQIMKNFEAIEAERNPAALQKELAEHGALLKELRTKALAQSHRMGMMESMMEGATKDGEPKK